MQALVPQQHQGALTTDQHRALQVALQCATAAVESDAAMDAERARYFYIKAANTLSALGVQHERAASYVARAKLLEQQRPRSAGPPTASAPSAPSAPPLQQQQYAGSVVVGSSSAPAIRSRAYTQQHSNQEQQQQQAAQRAAVSALVASTAAAPNRAIAGAGAAVGSSSAPASAAAAAAATKALAAKKPKSQVHKSQKWWAFEQKARAEYRGGVAHCHDREHRHGKRMFVQSAESYQLAIQHARRERPDVLVLLQQGFEKALTMAEKLHAQLQPVYNPSAEKGPAAGLAPIFSGPDTMQRRRSKSPKAAAAARHPKPSPNSNPARARPAPATPSAAAAAAAAAAAGGGGSSITPPYWDRSIKYNKVDFVMRALTPKCQAYKNAALKFYETMDPNEYMIVSIELLQHPRKWASYNAQKEILDNALPKGSNEVQAFHGTRAEHVQTILAQGYLRDHNTHSAWGKGSYFARNAKFSVPTYCPPDKDGICNVFLSRLLVGEPCLGGPGKALPDPKPNGSGALHESMVDNISSPTIFVLGSGSDNAAYPELLMKIKKLI